LRQKAFTLIEILVAVIVISLAAAVAVPSIVSSWHNTVDVSIAAKEGLVAHNGTRLSQVKALWGLTGDDAYNQYGIDSTVHKEQDGLKIKVDNKNFKSAVLPWVVHLNYAQIIIDPIQPKTGDEITEETLVVKFKAQYYDGENYSDVDSTSVKIENNSCTMLNQSGNIYTYQCDVSPFENQTVALTLSASKDSLTQSKIVTIKIGELCKGTLTFQTVPFNGKWIKNIEYNILLAAQGTCPTYTVELTSDNTHLNCTLSNINGAATDNNRTYEYQCIADNEGNYTLTAEMLKGTKPLDTKEQMIRVYNANYSFTIKDADNHVKSCMRQDYFIYLTPQNANTLKLDNGSYSVDLEALDNSGNVITTLGANVTLLSGGGAKIQITTPFNYSQWKNIRLTLHLNGYTKSWTMPVCCPPQENVAFTLNLPTREDEAVKEYKWPNTSDKWVHISLNECGIFTPADSFEHLMLHMPGDGSDTSDFWASTNIAPAHWGITGWLTRVQLTHDYWREHIGKFGQDGHYYGTVTLSVRNWTLTEMLKKVTIFLPDKNSVLLTLSPEGSDKLLWQAQSGHGVAFDDDLTSFYAKINGALLSYNVGTRVGSYYYYSDYLNMMNQLLRVSYIPYTLPLSGANTYTNNNCGFTKLHINNISTTEPNNSRFDYLEVTIYLDNTKAISYKTLGFTNLSPSQITYTNNSIIQSCNNWECTFKHEVHSMRVEAIVHTKPYLNGHFSDPPTTVTLHFTIKR